MSGMAIVQKAPDDELDYDVDFGWWLPFGDRVISATTSISNSTATITRTEYSDSQVKVWIAGGDDGDNATVTVDATTLQGRTKEVCFRMRIKGC